MDETQDPQADANAPVVDVPAPTATPSEDEAMDSKEAPETPAE